MFVHTLKKISKLILYISWLLCLIFHTDFSFDCIILCASPLIFHASVLFQVTLSGYDLVTGLIDVCKPRPRFKSTCAFRNSL